MGSTNYNIAINIHLPSRDAILKNHHNKRRLSRMLSIFTINTQNTGVFGNEETDVAIISYVLQAVGEGNNVVRALCDDTDVFALLVDVEEPACGQVPDANGAALNINQTCTKLGSKGIQLLGMHTLIGCDTTSFPFNKCNVSALGVLEAGDFPGLSHAHREEDVIQWDPLDVRLSLFCAL